MWRKLTQKTKSTVFQRQSNATSLTNEWILSTSDINLWRSKISMEVRDGSVVSDMVSYLHFKTLHIGPNTMAHGLLQCLHQACLSGAFRFVQYIIENYSNDFNINTLNLFHPTCYFDLPEDAPPSDKASHRRETILHAAIIGKSVSIVKLLISYGISVNLQNCCFKTPLILALEEQNENIVSILLDHHLIDCNCCDNDGLTPLMYCVRIPALVDFIPRILQLGANLITTNARGYTALHIAFAEGSPKATQYLIEHLGTKLLCDVSIHPYAYAVVDQQNFLYHALNLENRLKEFHELLKNLPRKIFSAECLTDLCLLKASWYMTLYARSDNESDTFLVNCKHAIYEGFAEGCLRASDSLTNIATYNHQRELASLDDVKDMYSQNLKKPDLILTLFYQSLLVRERCLGYSDLTLIYSLLWFGKWLINQYKVSDVTNFFEEGLSLWLRGTEMLLDHIETYKPISSSICNLVITLLHMLTGTQVKISPPDEYQVVLFGDVLCKKLLTPIIQKIIICVSRSIALTKNRHTHLITQKSFLPGIQSLLELLHGFFMIKPKCVNIEYFIQVLVQNCPKIIIDANGLPTTLVHVLLQLDSIKRPEIFIALILENNGQWMVNGIGPLGMRPLHLTHREEVISLFLEYGAHLDSVNAYNVSVIKDLHNRRPDLFPEPTINSCPIPLKCLAANTIANNMISYAQMHIPPSLKRFISLHDQCAQDALLRGELDFVFTE